jgi:hypothetical protein
MKYKQLIQKKIFELNNFLNGQDALLSTGRSIDEIRAHIERMRAKLLEIETLINSESEG